MIPGLIPDRIDLVGGAGRSGAGTRARPGEDEGLVTELVERRADLTGDDGLPRGDPLRDEPDSHRVWEGVVTS